ncbi:MAG: alcohol dehydrogenase catalytic domain-containing protein [Actinobacteria bacterium]|nr:alcohol dehydrogenase catalytic domain-containing protein [Actinomycetota bacterium]
MTRGIVYAEPGATLTLEEIVVDPPGPREVQVRVHACGLCHSDLHVVETGGWGMRFPILLGHEGAGIVEEVGAEVTGVAPGDRVVVAWRAPCGECPQCRRGDPRRCSSQLRAKRRLHRAADDALLTPVLRCGSFAERVVVHEACAVPIPEELPFEQACLLACGFSTGAGAALWATPVREGSTVAVIGCGGVGLAVVQGARLAGAERIVAVDVAPEKLAVAEELGATDAVDGTAGDAVDQVRELTGGVGVDFAFSAIGAPVGLDQAVRMCAYAGTATLVGIPLPDSRLGVDLDSEIFGPKVAIAVTHGGDTIPQQDFPFLAQAALDGKLDLARFVSSTCSLEDVPERLPRIGRDGEIRAVAVF